MSAPFERHRFATGRPNTRLSWVCSQDVAGTAAQPPSHIPPQPEGLADRAVSSNPSMPTDDFRSPSEADLN